MILFLQPPFPYFTWDCANDLEDRFKKTLYHGGKRNCMGAVSPVALTGMNQMQILYQKNSTSKNQLEARQARE